MAHVSHRQIGSNGIEVHIAEAGAGPPVVLCHGFPELSSAWRHQLHALADAGCHAVAPDMRGYGLSDVPEEVGAYDIEHLADDVVGVIDALGEDSAVVVGHDLGAITAWHLGLSRPERLDAVVALSVPHQPRYEMPPTELFELVFPDTFFYMLYFQAPGPADLELSRDPREFLRRFYRTVSGEGPGMRSLPRQGAGILDALDDSPGLPSFLTETELDETARQFARTGFTPALNWYRNLDRNWRLTESLAAAVVSPPSLFLAGDRDPITALIPASGMKGVVDDLRGVVTLAGCGHWTPEERPEEVNRGLIEFIGSLPRR